MKRIIVKCHDDGTRAEWRNLCNRIDDELTYEEIIQLLVAYFEEDDSRIKAVRTVDEPIEFR